MFVDSLMDFFGNTTKDTPIPEIIQKFTAAWNKDSQYAVKALLHLRDCRNGKGLRRAFIVCMVYLKSKCEYVYKQISHLIPMYGCWRDVLKIHSYSIMAGLSGSHEVSMFAKQIQEDLKTLKMGDNPSLAGKWAPNEKSHYKKFAFRLMKMLGVTPKEYRKTIVKLRNKLNVLEQNITNKDYERIEFSTIPALAHVKYSKMFNRGYNSKFEVTEFNTKLKERYSYYLYNLKDGCQDIKITGIQPQDIIKMYNKDKEYPVGKTVQWDYLVDTRKHLYKNTMAIYDTSNISQQKRDLAIGMSLLISECCDNKYFNNKLVSFGDDCRMYDLGGKSLGERIDLVKDMKLGSVNNIDLFLEKLLGVAKGLSLGRDEMIDRIFIMSDTRLSKSKIDKTLWWMKSKYENAGYRFPEIVYWELCGCRSNFVVNGAFNVLSGFSWDVVDSVITLEGFNPEVYMNRTLGYYSGCHTGGSKMDQTTIDDFLKVFKE